MVAIIAIVRSGSVAFVAFFRRSFRDVDFFFFYRARFLFDDMSEW